MRPFLSILTVASLVVFTTVPALDAKDIVVNDGFELPGWGYWTDYGNPDLRLIDYYDVVNGYGGPNSSNCYAQLSSGGMGGNDGGLRQEVYVIAGVTYTVSADLCYHNC
jgi:hypothetical protein